MKALENAKGFLAPVDSVAEANQQYSLLSTALEEYINKVPNLLFFKKKKKKRKKKEEKEKKREKRSKKNKIKKIS